MYKSILKAFFRASLIATIVFAGHHFVQQHNIALQADALFAEGERVLNCANDMSDEYLKQHFNGYTINLQDIDCSDRRFIASIDDIRNPAQWMGGARPTYAMYVGPQGIAAAGVGGFILVNVIGLVLVLLLATVNWIGGRETKAAMGKMIGDAEGSQHGVRQWAIPIATGTIAILVGGLLLTMFSGGQ